MEEAIPSNFAILTANVRYDPDLTANAKLLFAEISALSNKLGFCFASNNHFAKLYNVTPQAVSKWIGQLEKKEYIMCSYVLSGKEIKERHIYINTAKMTPEDSEQYTQKTIEVSTNDLEGINIGLTGYQQMFKDNNKFNNKFNNSTNTPSEPFPEDPKKKVNKLKSKSVSKAKEYEPIMDSEFYKEVFNTYKTVFFNLQNGGVPNCKDYKRHTDNCILRLRELGIKDEAICRMIIEAIKRAPTISYWRNEAKGSFSYIVSETGMNKLTGTSIQINKGQTAFVDKDRSYENDEGGF